MANILIAPNKYVQGRGELANLQSYTKPLGKKPLILISQSGYGRFGKVLESGYGADKDSLVFDYFNGECSNGEITRISGLVKEHSCDVIVGVGGGKILDTAKAVAYHQGLPVAIVPTIASTDAPCSALSVIYTDQGVFESYLFLSANPNVVIMDTEIVTQSPARLTVSGMGDALATFFEARATKAKGATTCAGGTNTNASLALAKLCLETLLEEGLKAKVSLEAGACTKAVESVIEANTLLSGLGFESGGLAAAHAIHNGFTVLEECHSMYHGEKVAFGTLTQLILENVSTEELAEIYGFCISVGLPVTLKELGITTVTQEKIMAVAQATCVEGESIHNMPFAVCKEDVCAAILSADAMGQYFLAN